MTCGESFINGCDDDVLHVRTCANDTPTPYAPPPPPPPRLSSYSKTWSDHNNRYGIDITMGICGTILRNLAPIWVVIKPESWDPNMQADYDGNRISINEQGQVADASYVPRFVQEVIKSTSTNITL